MSVDLHERAWAASNCKPEEENGEISRGYLPEAASKVANFGSLPSPSGRQARSVLETSKDSKEVKLQDLEQ